MIPVQLTSVYSGMQIISCAEWSSEEAQEWASQIMGSSPRNLPDADMGDAELAGAIGLTAVNVQLIEPRRVRTGAL